MSCAVSISRKLHGKIIKLKPYKKSIFIKLYTFAFFSNQLTNSNCIIFTKTMYSKFKVMKHAA